MNRNELFNYVKRTYNKEPSYLFKGSPETAVLRHGAGKKWFAVILRISGERLGLGTEEEVDVLDVKADPELIGILQTQAGYLPAYHMNKEHWISILLDGTVGAGQIRSLIDGSYELTKDGKTGKNG